MVRKEWTQPNVVTSIRVADTLVIFTGDPRKVAVEVGRKAGLLRTAALKIDEAAEELAKTGFDKEALQAVRKLNPRPVDPMPDRFYDDGCDK